ncbi:CdaR family transcriptional regulator [Cohnella hongkongensis]|uniref:CdaR family transcriptional regulator n=1 Tax=Cohnella hongkongensis TaxID=178337 RepID=A0ABV9FGL3_9BACL
MLSKELAEEIAADTFKRLKLPINLMDTSACIVASSDPARVGAYHAAAEEAIRTGRPVSVDGSVAKLRGVQPGVNLPFRYEDKVAGVVGITGDPDKVEPFGELVAMTVELMLRQRMLGLRHEWRQTLEELALEEAFRHDRTDDTLLNQRLAALGVPVRMPIHAAEIGLADSEALNGREPLLPVLRERLPDGAALVSRVSPTRFVLLLFGLEEPECLRRLSSLFQQLTALGLSCRIGVSSPADRLDLLPLIRDEAGQALRFGEADLFAEGPVPYARIEAEAFLQSVPAAQRSRLAARYGAALDEKMRSTLRALFACDLNLAETVRALGVHRNTLLYRLEQIGERTGLNPRRFRDALLLQFILWLSEKEAR